MSSIAAATCLEIVKVAMPQSYTFLESMISVSPRRTNIHVSANEQLDESTNNQYCFGHGLL